jgi:hypothetical protein
LVCAFSDYATKVQWGCDGTDLIDVPNVLSNGGIPTGLGSGIGDGINNTNNILNDCPSAPAVLAARSLGPEWFLPSAKELNQMYIHKTTIEVVAGFAPFSIFYWSSSEYGNLYGWVHNLGTGQKDLNGKANINSYVRAVRAF